MKPRSLLFSFALLAGASACENKEPPPPELVPSAPAAPARSTPFAPLSAVIASASAPPPPKTPPLPGIPAVDTSCAKDADCDKTFFDDACCNQCEPRIGSKAWTAKMTTFCKAHPASGCPPVSCGFVFGAPRCNDGKCMPR